MLSFKPPARLCPRIHVFFLLYRNRLKIAGEELRRQRRSVSWFARELYCDRTNVYKLFRKESIDTLLLFRISTVLSHDFFKYYTEEFLSGKQP